MTNDEANQKLLEPSTNLPPELAEALARWFFDGVECSGNPANLLYGRPNTLITVTKGLQVAVLTGLKAVEATTNSESVTNAVLEARNQLLRAKAGL
jgi:hypothetical protein